jgi:lipoic acid synthetase/lipoyl(octanoyl) transferase
MDREIAKVCRVLQLGRTLYGDAWEQQQDIAAARRKGIAPDTLLLLEHEAVYTIGRAGSEANIKVSPETLALEGLRVVEVDRGGDITYHGPGQLVGYPILDLTEHGRDLHHYSWMLEEVIIRTVAEFGIKGFREKGLTGVWTTAGKIAAIGIGVHNWISTHGFALNVNPDMRYFGFINPCGITDRAVVSLQSLGIDTCMGEVRRQVTQHFAAVFNVEIFPGNIGVLPGGG